MVSENFVYVLLILLVITSRARRVNKCWRVIGVMRRYGSAAPPYCAPIFCSALLTISAMGPIRTDFEAVSVRRYV